MYKESDIVAVAKRKNNKKRNYLVVNRLQGKHIPVSPKSAFDMFGELADVVKKKYDGQKLLVIGFAETATAIGTHVAWETDSYYIQTTREEVEGAEYIYFSESHSHATEQRLVKNDLDKVLKKIDKILFVEDEVTTGNTIMNIVKMLKKLYPEVQGYAVASIINGMNAEALKRYEDADIDISYLVKTDNNAYSEIADKYPDETGIEAPLFGRNEGKYAFVRRIIAGGYINPRNVCRASDYVKACDDVAQKICENINMDDDKSILVMGTEECMYPAMYLGCMLEDAGHMVRTHSTTRSPITVYDDEDYPLHERYLLHGMYDKDRETFIYDIAEYDRVIVLTDSEKIPEKGEDSLVDALIENDNKNISIIRWNEVADIDEDQL